MTTVAMEQQGDRCGMGSVLLALMLVLSGGGLPYVFLPTFCTLAFFAALAIAVGLQAGNLLNKEIEIAVVAVAAAVVVLTVNYLMVPFDNGVATYASVLLRIITAILFFLYIRAIRSDYVTVISRALRLVMLHALISFVLGYFVQNQLVAIETDSYAAQTFLYLFYYRTGTVDILESKLIRNQGIFWEPGILQIYMNILFFIATFVRKNKWVQYGSALVILTTYSTTGIGLLLLQTMVTLRDVARRGLFSVLAVLLVITAVGVMVRMNVTDKFSGSGEMSAIFRVYDFQEAVRLIQEYPLTGIGLDQQAYKQAQSNNYDSEMFLDELRRDAFIDRGNSNALLMLIATLGIPMSLIILVLLWRQDLIPVHRWLFYAIIAASMLSEPLLLTPFFLLFTVSGLMRSRQAHATRCHHGALAHVCEG